MKKSGKKAAAVLGGALVFGACLGASMNIMVLTPLSRKIKAHEAKRNAAPPKPNPQAEALSKESRDWYEAQQAEHIMIENNRGERLHAKVVKNSAETHNWVICVHGYTSQPDDMSEYVYQFNKMGFSVLLPFLRGHGDSEERRISMGWLDRKDILNWISYLTKLDTSCRIVLHGVSMGGATVMMTTGEELPANVKCCIADCGYSSVWDVFKNELHTLRVPVFPTLYLADAATFLIDRYGFKTASSVEQLKKSKTPTLFIHGEKDDFVPYEMLDLNYNAAACPKEKLSIPDAAHAESHRIHPELYWPAVQKFIEKYLGVPITAK